MVWTYWSLTTLLYFYAQIREDQRLRREPVYVRRVNGSVAGRQGLFPGPVRLPGPGHNVRREWELLEDANPPRGDTYTTSAKLSDLWTPSPLAMYRDQLIVFKQWHLGRFVSTFVSTRVRPKAVSAEYSAEHLNRIFCRNRIAENFDYYVIYVRNIIFGLCRILG